MTNNPHTTTQSGEKPAYVPPRVIRLGDLNEGSGACNAGSGFQAANCNPVGSQLSCGVAGAGFTGTCTGMGESATGSCTPDGGNAAGVCNMMGGTP